MRSLSSSILINKFYISAGGILMDEKRNQVCLIKKALSCEYLLPKGTKEPDEDLATTARREIFEETGYENNVAPEHLLGILFRPHIGGAPEQHKVVFWYYAVLKSSIHYENTQEEHENFTNVWCSLEEAMEKLSFEEDKVLVRRAFHYARLEEMPKGGMEGAPTFRWCGPEDKCIRLLTPPSVQLSKGFVVIEDSGKILLVLNRSSKSWDLPSDEEPILTCTLDGNTTPFMYQLHLDLPEIAVREWYCIRLKMDPIADSKFVSREEALEKMKHNQDAIHILNTAFEKLEGNPKNT